MKVVLDICKRCNKEFEKTGNRQIYCSRVCWAKKHYEEYIKDWYLRKPENCLLSGARYRAKRKDLEFDISLEDIVIPEHCPILNIKLEKQQTGKAGFYASSPSLDRIDPSKGYVKGNIRVISSRANLLKSNASLEELEKIVDDARLLRHRS